MFGPPDMITKSGPGEMWGYDKVSREVARAADGSATGLSAGALGLVGGYGQSSQQSRRTESTTTFFMLIYFDEEDVVTNYKLSATKF